MDAPDLSERQGPAHCAPAFLVMAASQPYSQERCLSPGLCGGKGSWRAGVRHSGYCPPADSGVT